VVEDILERSFAGQQVRRDRRLDRQDLDQLRPDRESGLAARQPARKCGVENVGAADEVRDECGPRSCVQLPRRVELLDASFAEHCDAVRHAERLALVMRDEHECDSEALLQALELGLHFLAQLQVERAERLVEQQHARLVDQGPRQCHPLLLSAGKLVRSAIAEFAEADEVEHLQCTLAAIRRRDAAHPGPVGHVLGDRHVRKERVVLEHRVDVALVRRRVRDVAAVKQDAPVVRTVETSDQAQAGRLAGA